MAHDPADAALVRLRALAFQNPANFMQTQLWIQDKDGNRVKLRPTWSQQQYEDCVQEMERQGLPVRIIVVKGRQVGISTWGCGRIYTRTRGVSNRNALIVGQLEETIEKLFRKIHYFEQNLDPKWKLPVKHLNKGQLEYNAPFNSQITLATAGSLSAGRSLTLQDVHLTECGHYKYGLNKFKGALEPSVPYKPGTSIIMESTTNGVGDDFHQQYQMAKEKKSPYWPLFIPWQGDSALERPFRSQREQDAYLERAFAQYPELIDRQQHFKLSGPKIAFYYDMLTSLNGDLLLCQQEFPCSEDEAFVAGGATIFSVPLVDHYKMRTTPGVVFDPWQYESIEAVEHDEYIRKGQDPYIEIWKRPRRDRTYWISADSAGASEESDHSCVYVFDLVTQNICAKLYGRINPKPLAKLIEKIGRWYNYAQVVPEVDGTGVALLEELKEIYFNLYQQRKIEGYKTIILPNKLGWETTQASRTLMIRHARQLLRERKDDAKHFIPDADLVSELHTFVNRDGKPQAANGCRDDMVMSWLIGVYTCFHGLNIDPNANAPKSPEKKESSIILPATPEDMIAMVQNPNWCGKPIDMKSVYEAPFNYGDYY